MLASAAGCDSMVISRRTVIRVGSALPPFSLSHNTHHLPCLLSLRLGQPDERRVVGPGRAQRLTVLPVGEGTYHAVVHVGCVGCVYGVFRGCLEVCLEVC